MRIARKHSFSGPIRGAEGIRKSKHAVFVSTLFRGSRMDLLGVEHLVAEFIVLIMARCLPRYEVISRSSSAICCLQGLTALQGFREA